MTLQKKAMRTPQGFTLVELLIVVAIIGLLASIGLPAFFTYVIRSKTAEAPNMLKLLGQSEVAFYSRPRYGATGNFLESCYVTAASAPAVDPIGVKMNFAGNAGTNAVGFGSATPVFFNYGVGASTQYAATVSQVAASASAAGICVTASDITAAPATGTAYQYAIATGNFDGDATYSKFYRALRTNATNQNVADLGPVVVVNELE